MCFQGSEGVSVAYGPESAIHHYHRCAEDAGSYSAYCQLVPVCVDRGRPSESRPERSTADHFLHLRRTRLQCVRPGPVGLHDGCG